MSDLIPEAFLKKHWGYSQFRPGQLDIVNSILNGNDTLALLPTGGGKSICFQVPAIMKEGMALVVSPLIALMKDQVDGLKKRDVSAALINSSQSWNETRQIMDNALRGHYKLLYASPERICSENFKGYLENLNISMLVVDEAHCISMWGSDFRPAFLLLRDVRASLSKHVPVCAFTASAPDWIQQEIVSGLNLRNVHRFQGEFERNNLTFQVINTENKFGMLLSGLKATHGCTIVFGTTRKEVKDLSEMLNQHGISADYYHGGLESTIRSKKQQAFLENRFRVMVCTNAFGMGVDKPDVRYVYHLAPSATPEDYYQEAGRAGRDGNRSFCILFYNPADWQRASDFLLKQHPPEETLKKCYHALLNAMGVAPGNGQDNAIPVDWIGIAETYGIRGSDMYFSLKTIEKLGLWQLSEGLRTPSKVMVVAPHNEVVAFKNKYVKLAPLLDLLLRSYGGIFDSYVSIYEPQIARRLYKEEEDIIQGLNLLKKAQIIDFTPRIDHPVITLLEPRSQYPSFDMKQIETLKQRRLASLRSMSAYTDTNQCRSVFWVKYFTNMDSGNCMFCDNCKKKFGKISAETITNEIILRLNKPMDFDVFMNGLPAAYNKEFTRTLINMLDEGKVLKSEENKLFLRP
jgi:ATP-dependent DNA helicase RecQ